MLLSIVFILSPQVSEDCTVTHSEHNVRSVGPFDSAHPHHTHRQRGCSCLPTHCASISEPFSIDRPVLMSPFWILLCPLPCAEETFSAVFINPSSMISFVRKSCEGWCWEVPMKIPDPRSFRKINPQPFFFSEPLCFCWNIITVTSLSSQLKCLLSHPSESNLATSETIVEENPLLPKIWTHNKKQAQNERGGVVRLSMQLDCLTSESSTSCSLPLINFSLSLSIWFPVCPPSYTVLSPSFSFLLSSHGWCLAMGGSYALQVIGVEKVFLGCNVHMAKMHRKHLPPKLWHPPPPTKTNQQH